jgi:hypothetical protein
MIYAFEVEVALVRLFLAYLSVLPMDRGYTQDCLLRENRMFGSVKNG